MSHRITEVKRGAGTATWVPLSPLDASDEEMRMNDTTIDWAQNHDGTPGKTWNPTTGCTNHRVGLCKMGDFPCYAYRIAHGRLKSRMLANKSLPPMGLTLKPQEKARTAQLADPFYPRLWESRLGDKDLFRSKPMGVFVDDMSDLFGVPDDWTDRVMDQIKIHRQHRFYTLTKQPQKLPTSPVYFPDNCWVGVTATDAASLWIALECLGRVTAKVKYLSIEPLLSAPFAPSWELNRTRLTNVDWVIIGSCSGSEKSMRQLAYKNPDLRMQQAGSGSKWHLQPPVTWVSELAAACTQEGIPVFLKNSLMNWLPEEEPFYHISRPSPGATEVARYRQEMPYTKGFEMESIK